MNLNSIALTAEDVATVLRPRYEFFQGDDAGQQLVLKIGFTFADQLAERHGWTQEERKTFLHEVFTPAGASAHLPVRRP
ncbi:hypothetical protein [Nonomuraea sp. NPDC050310]|uniref:hypothetical protein n=1 Tax=Nonomuraea sp. NPDC050310 TaxID=3154935 RepID=UPI0033C9D238